MTPYHDGMDSPALARPLPDIAATEALGAALGAVLRAGDVVALSGPLGAGKSALARAAIRARLEAPEMDAPSPTFTLVQTYAAPDGLEIWHVDLYRLDDPSELEELGLEEAFAGAAALIEWPERAGPFLPEDRLDIRLEPAGAGRRAAIAARGQRWRERIDGLL